MSEELKEDPKKIFKDFDHKTLPIAAASLGQVRSLFWLI